MNTTYESRRIEILRDSVSQKIAAGEVIERPASVVRELIDNAVDSGASEINVYIVGGGIQSITVIDNGCGMGAPDLEMCYLPHATSKISEVEDLDSISTLGFRGEALASITACADLSITSSVDGGDNAWKMDVRGGSSHTLNESRGSGGTSVTVNNLFHDLPGRRRFLKRTATEALMCKNMFLDKAIAFPEIDFRLFVDGDLKTFLPSATLKDRVSAAFGKDLPLKMTHLYEEVFDRFSVSLVAGDPSLSRRDRRKIYTYVNKRKIQDFSLVQAITHGFSEFYPGGTFPIAAVFIDIDPELADFNIHPAKREVRIRNAPEIHHSVVLAVRSLLSERFQRGANKIDAAEVTQRSLGWKSEYTASEVSAKTPGYRSDLSRGANTASGGARALLDATRHPSPNAVMPALQQQEFLYYGQAFALFLIAGRADVLYLIDQHAAHERYIFDLLMEGDLKVQDLLIPLEIKIERDVSEYLDRTREDFIKAGIGLKKGEDGTWLITSLPEAAVYLKQDIVAFIRTFRGTVNDIRHALYETIACKTAVKDGEVLDDVTAIELIEKAFNLPHPRCPHGRPVWVEIPRSELFTLVGRT